MRKLELNNNCVLTQEQMNSVVGGETGPLKKPGQTLQGLGTGLEALGVATGKSWMNVAGAVCTTVGNILVTVDSWLDKKEKETTPGSLVPEKPDEPSEPAKNDSIPNDSTAKDSTANPKTPKK